MSEKARWYVIQTNTNCENAVKTSIEKAFAYHKMEDLIFEVNIPMITETEIGENNQEKTVEHKAFPGYVLVKMIMTPEAQTLVRRTSSVTGFLGTERDPIPLTDEAVLAWGVEKREIKVGFSVGDKVKVTDGPLEGYYGIVDEIEPEKSRMRVIVSMFNRETPVDLEFDQIETVEED